METKIICVREDGSCVEVDGSFGTGQTKFNLSQACSNGWVICHLGVPKSEFVGHPQHPLAIGSSVLLLLSKSK